jgi:hypothetical protein
MRSMAQRKTTVAAVMSWKMGSSRDRRRVAAIVARARTVVCWIAGTRW